MSGKAQVGRRIVAEFLLIVIGVLVAFQVEGMRDARDLRSRADAQLDALLVDLQENREQLQALVQGQERVVEAGRVLVRVSNGNEPVQSVDSMVSVINRAAQFYRLEPVTGAYDALVASGDLRLIRNDSLRSGLANFVSAIREGPEDDELTLLLRTEMILAQSESTSMLSVTRPRIRAVADLPESATAPNIDGLLSNQRYMSLLTLIAGLEANILSKFERWEVEASRLIQLIEDDRGESL